MNQTIDFTKLTKKQLEVFEQIAIGRDTGHNDRTLESLVNKGYITCTPKQLPGWPPVKINTYSVSIPIHMAWCQWCSTRLDKENAG